MKKTRPFLLLAALSLALSVPAGAMEGGYPATGEPVSTRGHATASHDTGAAVRKTSGGAAGRKSGGTVRRKARNAATRARSKGHAKPGNRSGHAHGHVHVEPARPGDLKPAEALNRLLAGNKRFVAATFVHPDKLGERRTALARTQRPFAAILGCADSRVPPEFVFDQGLGDLFVVRVAGNVTDDHVLGSLEYAVEHLGSSLILVLGHERCGAVSAAVAGGEAGGHVSSLVEAISPAVRKAKATRPATPDDLIDLCVRTHAHDVAMSLTRRSPVLAAYAKAGRLQIEGARYDLDTGTVDLIK